MFPRNPKIGSQISAGDTHFHVSWPYCPCGSVPCEVSDLLGAAEGRRRTPLLALRLGPRLRPRQPPRLPLGDAGVSCPGVCHGLCLACPPRPDPDTDDSPLTSFGSLLKICFLSETSSNSCLQDAAALPTGLCPFPISSRADPFLVSLHAAPGAPLWPGRPSLPPSFLLPPLPGPSSSPSVPPCAPGLVTRACPSLRTAPPGTCPWETGDKAFPRLGSHPQVHGSASSPSRPFLSPCKSVPAPPDGGERLRPSNSTGPEPTCSPRWSSRSPRDPPAPPVVLPLPSPRACCLG